MAEKTLENRVVDLEDRVEQLEKAIDGGAVERIESDMPAFLANKSPSTHVERVTTLGYYIVHNEGEKSFTVSDIQAAYDKCRLPNPANLSDVLSGAEERGWMKRNGTQGRKQLWTITLDGDEVVERGFEQ